jgi:hypothetical protein
MIRRLRARHRWLIPCLALAVFLLFAVVLRGAPR